MQSTLKTLRMCFEFAIQPFYSVDPRLIFFLIFSLKPPSPVHHYSEELIKLLLTTQRSVRLNVTCRIEYCLHIIKSSTREGEKFSSAASGFARILLSMQFLVKFENDQVLFRFREPANFMISQEQTIFVKLCPWSANESYMYRIITPKQLLSLIMLPVKYFLDNLGNILMSC